MAEQEREKLIRKDEDPDVEGHKKHYSEGAEPPKREPGMRGEPDEEPDVEAHKKH